MNQPEDRLAKALEALSAAMPEGAPPTVESNLKAAFRRHHLRRRRQRQAIFALTLASCMIILGAIILKSRSIRVQPDHPLVAERNPENPAPIKSTSPNTDTIRTPHGPKMVIKFAKPVRARLDSPAPDSSFVSLPSYDAAFSDGGVRIVRVNLSSSDLYQIGAPQLSYPGVSRTVADVMFDRDGIPIAVRRIGK